MADSHVELRRPYSPVAMVACDGAVATVFSGGGGDCEEEDREGENKKEYMIGNMKKLMHVEPAVGAEL
ncbi:hypothetical protein GUJ93_ZPchr0013g36675 [Zizania palustris]|uniref:Uncharacterized protein n=1 Tax=Zizania palustris TaxID=103762 RepID=A0A8J5X477_ZIZPA|nr:hypothetical protein GUJ93_ZPchr0013g36675 [Zizania palustris]